MLHFLERSGLELASWLWQHGYNWLARVVVKITQPSNSSPNWGDHDWEKEEKGD